MCVHMCIGVHCIVGIFLDVLMLDLNVRTTMRYIFKICSLLCYNRCVLVEIVCLCV